MLVLNKALRAFLMFLGISGIVWLLLGVVGVIVLTVLIAQRTSQYGGARLMFLAPAGLFLPSLSCTRFWVRFG